MQDFTYTQERKVVRLVAGIDRKSGKAVFREGRVPVIVNRNGQTVTSVTVLSDATSTGKAEARLMPNAVYLT